MASQSHMICAFSTNVDSEVKVTRRCDDDPLPSDVIVNYKGQYLVVDSEAAVIRLYAEDGSYICDAGAKNLRSAWGIVQTNSGKVIVSDPSGHDLKVFSKSGRFLTNSEYGIHLIEPHGIAYDAQTCRVAVADRAACCVYIHEADGKVKDVLKVTSETKTASEGQISPRSSEKSRPPPMTCPTYVAFTSQGDIVVSDMESHYVYCFNVKSGDLQWTSSSGQQDDLFSCPCGLEIDKSQGHILVADSGNSRIVALDNAGEYVSDVLTWRSGVMDPRGLHLTHKGHLVVTEGSTGIVKVFDYKALMATASKGSVSDSDDSDFL